VIPPETVSDLPAPPSPLTDTRGQQRVLLVLAIVLTGFSMRTAVTSVGAVLVDLQHGLHVSGLAAGWITTLPVLCFAAVGAAGPWLTRQLGTGRALVGAMCCACLGLAARSVATNVWTFAAASVLSLAGGAISNVSMPTLVKRHFPDRIAPMTATYTTALALGATAASGLTVPIGTLGSPQNEWRVGLGSWAIFAALAIPPWLPLLGKRTERDMRRAGLSGWALRGSVTAWALTFFFAGQSFQAYVAFGWFARFFRDHGTDSARAGVLVAFYAALSIPAAAIAPWLAARAERRTVLAFCTCYLLGYIGLAAKPVAASWLWMLLIGIGSGLFPVALTMIGLHTRHVTVTATVSAFVQSIGYVFAGTGPVLVGWLVGRGEGWTGPFVCLFAALAVTLVSGLVATRSRSVDSEIGFRPRPDQRTAAATAA
jgi:MFS transporter, CP family, cyanate transporter